MQDVLFPPNGTHKPTATDQEQGVRPQAERSPNLESSQEASRIELDVAGAASTDAPVAGTEAAMDDVAMGDVAMSDATPRTSVPGERLADDDGVTCYIGQHSLHFALPSHAVPALQERVRLAPADAHFAEAVCYRTQVSLTLTLTLTLTLSLTLTLTLPRSRATVRSSARSGAASMAIAARGRLCSALAARRPSAPLGSR